VFACCKLISSSVLAVSTRAAALVSTRSVITRSASIMLLLMITMTMVAKITASAAVGPSPAEISARRRDAASAGTTKRLVNLTDDAKTDLFEITHTRTHGITWEIFLSTQRVLGDVGY
jgi:hypothetical protein